MAEIYLPKDHRFELTDLPRERQIPFHGQDNPELYTPPKVFSMETVAGQLRTNPELKLLLSFDFHGVLAKSTGYNTAPEERMREVLAQTDALKERLGDRLEVVVNTAARPSRVTTNLPYPVIGLNGVTMRETDTSELTPLLPDDQFAKMDAVRQRFVERVGVPLQYGEGFEVPLSQIRDQFPLTTEGLASYVETLISADDAPYFKVVLDSKKEKIVIRLNTYKSEGNARYLEMHDFDPSKFICMHFGDENIDIPREPMRFNEYYLVSPSHIKPDMHKYASVHSEYPSGEFVVDTLRNLGEALDRPQQAFDTHPYSAYVDSLAAIDVAVAEPQADQPKGGFNRERELLRDEMDEFARRMVATADQIVEKLHPENGDVAIFSLLRDGLFTSIALQQLLLQKYGIHMPITGGRLVFHGKNGADTANAYATARAIRDAYPDINKLLIVDSWTGSGASVTRAKLLLNQGLNTEQDDTNIAIYSAAPIDPTGTCDFGVKSDMVHPYLLNKEDHLGLREVSRPDPLGNPLVVVDSPDSAYLQAQLQDVFQRMRAVDAAGTPQAHRLVSGLPTRRTGLSETDLRYRVPLGINESIDHRRVNHTIYVPAGSPEAEALQKLDIPFVAIDQEHPYGLGGISIPPKVLANTQTIFVGQEHTPTELVVAK